MLVASLHTRVHGRHLRYLPLRIKYICTMTRNITSKIYHAFYVTVLIIENICKRSSCHNLQFPIKYALQTTRLHFKIKVKVKVLDFTVFRRNIRLSSQHSTLQHYVVYIYIYIMYGVISTINQHNIAMIQVVQTTVSKA